MVRPEKSATEWYREGRRWAQEQVWAAALECGERALTLAPDDPDVLFLLGEACEKEDRLQRTRNYFQRLDPELSHAWYGQATALWRLDRQHEALRSVDRALALRPSDSCRWLRSQTLEALGGDATAPEPS